MKRGQWWERYLVRLIGWREKYVGNRSFVFILAVIIGIFGGLAAVLLKSLVLFIQNLLTGGASFAGAGLWLVVFPAIGILITVLYKYLIHSGRIGQGIPNVLYDLKHRSGLIPRHRSYSHILTSSTTVGFGGSVGLEAPIVSTGSAIGSNLARTFKLDQQKRSLFIGCGAAAGIGGIFNAPIAGVIFSLEVLLLELAIPAYIPLLIASVTGTIISMYLMGGDIFLLDFVLNDPFNLREVPVYVLLGVITGLVSVYFNRTAMRTEKLMQNVLNPYKKALLGGGILGIMLLFFPPLYGEGFYTLEKLFEGNPQQLLQDNLFFEGMADQFWFLTIFLGVMIFLKVIAAAVTYGAGGNGGIFAPTLFVGGITGYLTGTILNFLNILPYRISEENLTLVGMAGVVSGVQHAPLTAIFLIAEITGGYMLILPLIIVSAIAFATTTYFDRYSLFEMQLTQKGEPLETYHHDQDHNVLTLLKLRDLVEQDLVVVHPDQSLRDLVNAVSKSKRNIFPVVNDNGELEGIVPLDNIRKIMFRPELYDEIKVHEVLKEVEETLSIEESMESVMDKFDNSGKWNLPVLENGKYLGFISKSKIFNHYRDELIQQNRDEQQIIE